MSLARRIEAWIAAEIEQAGVSGVVVGLSGGLDSAVVSGLCAPALGADKVLGVIMPAHSLPADAEDARLVAEAWGIEHSLVDLSGVSDALMALLPEGTQLARANIKPRLRMIVLYYLANSLGRAVVGTGNRSELMVGYFTKYGDSGVDLLPLAGVYKHQVFDIAREIGVPQQIIDRPPSAGLWAGQTDESEMGVTYADLDRVLEAMATGTDSGVSPDVVARVERMVRGSEHKRRLPPMFSLDESS